MPPDFRTVDIPFARRIVGVGSGASPLINLSEALALLLEGSIAATRPVVDDGFVPRERMIGQTGKTVSPGLYVALGISGSPHHVAGIQPAGRVLSLNIDAGAPIFGFSDTGFVCDLAGLLPKLIDRINRYRDERVPMKTYDAIVVGAGPAGTTASLRMAQKGLRCARRAGRVTGLEEHVRRDARRTAPSPRRCCPVSGTTRRGSGTW